MSVRCVSVVVIVVSCAAASFFSISEAPPSLLRGPQVNKDVWKTFDGEEYHGVVTYAHVLVSGSEVLYHVVSSYGMDIFRRKDVPSRTLDIFFFTFTFIFRSVSIRGLAHIGVRVRSTHHLI